MIFDQEQPVWPNTSMRFRRTGGVRAWNFKFINQIVYQTSFLENVLAQDLDTILNFRVREGNDTMV